MDGRDGIMILLKNIYLINMIDQQQNNNVKLILQFFNLKNNIIHTTDRTEVEVENEVNKYPFY